MTRVRRVPEINAVDEWSSEQAELEAEEARSGCSPRVGVWIAILGCLGFVLLLGLFSTLFLPRMVQQLVEATQAKVEADFERIGVALDAFALDHDGRYPDTLEELGAAGPGGEPYLARDPLDPWDRPYRYEAPGADGRWRVYTLGSDGEPGGKGASEDRERVGE